MTREQLIDLIARMLWMRGIASKDGARNAAIDIVDILNRSKMLILND